MNRPTPRAGERTEPSPNSGLPPFATDPRRWKLALRAALLSLGYQPGDAFSGEDRMLVLDAARVMYLDAAIPTGESELSGSDRAWLAQLGLLR
jgi:hypothetical protein